MTSEQDWVARLAEPLARATERDGRVASQLADRDERPPEPGDVYLALGDAGDREWVVVALDEAGRRVRVAPADQDPIVGSGDVRLDEGSDCAPLTVRCRLARWIRAGDLDGARRTGCLEPGELARILERLARVDDARFTPDPLEAEVDESPVYRELSEALRALPEGWADAVAPAAAPAVEAARPPAVVTTLPRAGRARLVRTLAIAASLVAVTFAGARLSSKLGAERVGYRGDADRPVRLILSRVAADDGRIVELQGARRLDAAARLAIAVEVATPGTLGIYAVDPDGHAARLGCAQLAAGRHRLGGEGGFGPDVAETGHTPFALSPAGRHLILAAVGTSAACPDAPDLGADLTRGLGERGWTVTSTTVEVVR